MAGGKGGAKKLRRVSPAKSPAKPGGSATKGSATKARACSSAVAPAAEAAAESVPETLSMALDDKTAASITLQIKKQRGGKAGASSSSGGAVLYVGHIPHGFYEEQMKGFFSQFGDVKRLHLARNRKTGNSKHYAFVEFAHAEVAHIVAKAMHGYLMYSKILVCQVVPPDEVHPNTFKNSGQPFRLANWLSRERKRHNQVRTLEQAETHEKKLLSGERRKRRKLVAAGIDYEFPGYEGAAAARSAKRRKVAEA